MDLTKLLFSPINLIDRRNEHAFPVSLHSLLYFYCIKLLLKVELILF